MAKVALLKAKQASFSMQKAILSGRFMAFLIAHIY